MKQDLIQLIENLTDNEILYLYEFAKGLFEL